MHVIFLRYNSAIYNVHNFKLCVHRIMITQKAKARKSCISDWLLTDGFFSLLTST